MPKTRLAIATCDRFPALAPDDRLLLEALGRRGIDAAPAVWNEPAVEWGEFGACLLRSPWDYYERHREFLAWVGAVEAAMPLWNPAALVAWNLEKTYLRELGERGVSTIPTEWVERGERPDLAALLAARGWEECVIKPTVDLGAFNLRRVRAGEPGAQEALDAVLERHGAMVQPFLTSIEGEGELSLVYIDGGFSHAVRKRPAAGDFRVQPIWGGDWAPAEPDAAELRMAGEALEGLEAAPLYARVDLVAGPEGDACLIELELIDPNLFLAAFPPAAEALADATTRRLP